MAGSDRAGAAWIAVLAPLLAGCPYRVTLTARPADTEITLPDGERIVPPADVRLRYVPFGHQWIRATAEGHRTFEVDLRRDEIRLFSLVVSTIAHPSTLWGRPRGEVRLVLMPEHGPAGTWAPEEIP